jgi:nanoRNase/pAp phosphatase (c-di-AMP/oligoRNAs hydrolase)
VRSEILEKYPNVLASKVAQKYGGGGQKTAACFHILKADFERNFMSNCSQENIKIY